MTRTAAGAFGPVTRVVSARTGLRFADRRRGVTEATIERAMRAAGFASVVGYAEALEADPGLFGDLVAEMTVGETYFFREPYHFDFLRHEALPDLDRRHGGRRRHFWSAGCSSGEEAYSLAILLTDTNRVSQSAILGTDISRPAVARAREGVYRAWSLRGLDEELVRRFFRLVGDNWVLDEQIRRQVTFSWQNLLDPTPLAWKGMLDVVLCRNVLIHFEPDAVERAGYRLFECLAEGGWLITGASDPLLADAAPFDCVMTDNGVCYRRPVRRQPRVPVRAVAPRPPAPVPRRADERDVDANDDPTRLVREVQGVADRQGPVAGLRRAEELLRRYPLSAAIHLLRALLLAELGRHAEAVQAARRGVYLKPSGGVAPLLLSAILRRSELADVPGRSGVRKAKQS